MALSQVGLERLNTATTKKIGTAKNLVVNGAMNVAQRGTSSTTSGYGTVDRFKVTYSGTNENPTQAQVDVASGTTPYTSGFRKALKITNGNQTGGAGATDHIRIVNIIEGQDIANSGWNYKSASSFITLSFWVKSSVPQNFYGFIRNTDGTMYQYPFETGSLTTDTWTKITKTIPGNSNLTFDNDNGGAWELYIHQFAGTDETASGVTLNAWATYSGTAKMPDNTSTWYTTNDATFELTGMQLEVGSVATDFEHRTFAQEALLCKRYYQQIVGNSDLVMFGSGRASGTDAALVATQLAVPLRASPTIATVSYSAWGVGGSKSVSNGSPTVQSFNATDNQLNMQFAGLAGQMTNARTACVACDSGSTLKMDSEI